MTWHFGICIILGMVLACSESKDPGQRTGPDSLPTAQTFLNVTTSGKPEGAISSTVMNPSSLLEEVHQNAFLHFSSATMNLRAEPTTDSEIVYFVRPGTAVVVESHRRQHHWNGGRGRGSARQIHRFQVGTYEIKIILIEGET